MSEITAPITGNIWKILAAPGDVVEPEQLVAIIESMKLEIPVESEEAGTIARVLVAEGDAVNEGDVLFALE